VGSARSRIKYFKSSDLDLQCNLVGVLIPLMLAVNDMPMAADANDFWADTTERRRWLVTHLRGAEN